MELEERSGPTVTNVSGELAEAGTLSGEAGLQFDAEDPGSGVYQAIVEVDGKQVQRFVLDEDEGRCAPVAEPEASTPAFLYPEPCPHSLVGHVSLDTKTLPEGKHTLRVLVSDAAGNETPALERAVDVKNAAKRAGGEGEGGPAEKGGSTGSENGASAPVGAGGSAGTSASSGAGIGPAGSLTGGGALAGPLHPPLQGPQAPAAGAGATNGAPASANAKIDASWMTGKRRLRGSSLTVGYGRQARIEGRLTTASGKPIAGALVAISALPRYAGATSFSMRSVPTGANGRFSLTLKGVSSRRIELSYASTLGGSPSARASLSLSVRAGVRLRVAPRRTTLDGTITLSGKVLGDPVPHGGKEIVLEARSRGTRWLEFDVIRTNAHGRFEARHRFRLPGPIAYSFRAVSPSEADFPFSGGASKAVGVWER
ncbi:MAG: carboxypeptidase-like regulatory domain-containing protein [Solirubrobacteraceae bacterium]